MKGPLLSPSSFSSSRRAISRELNKSAIKSIRLSLVGNKENKSVTSMWPKRVDGQIFCLYNCHWAQVVSNLTVGFLLQMWLWVLLQLWSWVEGQEADVPMPALGGRQYLAWRGQRFRWWWWWWWRGWRGQWFLLYWWRRLWRWQLCPEDHLLGKHNCPWLLVISVLLKLALNMLLVHNVAQPHLYIFGLRSWTFGGVLYWPIKRSEQYLMPIHVSFSDILQKVESWNLSNEYVCLDVLQCRPADRVEQQNVPLIMWTLVSGKNWAWNEVT